LYTSNPGDAHLQAKYLHQNFTFGHNYLNDFFKNIWSYSANINENNINKPAGRFNNFYLIKEIIKLKYKPKKKL